MDAKKIIMIMLIASASFTFIVLAIIGIYRYEPEMLGLPPHPVDSTEVVEIQEQDTVEYVSTIEITRNRLERLQENIREKYSLKRDKDSLASFAISLLDSIKKYEGRLAGIKEEADSIKSSIAAVREVKDSLELAVNNFNDSLKIARDKLKLARQKISDQEEFIEMKQDTLQEKNFETFAKIYNNAEPADIARILEQIDERDAAKILKLMRKKKAGKVLDAMQPEHAAAILLLGASE